jgi:hypothetical protein
MRRRAAASSIATATAAARKTPTKIKRPDTAYPQLSSWNSGRSLIPSSEPAKAAPNQTQP